MVCTKKNFQGNWAIAHGFCGFFFCCYLKLKGELALAYESYAIGNSYCYYDHYLFYLVVAGNNEPFRVIPSKSSG